MTPFLFAALLLPAADPSLAADEALLKRAGHGTDAAALHAFLRARTVTGDQRAQVARALVDLGHDEFARREQASAALRQMGRFAVPELKKALASPDREVRRRAAECLEQIEGGSELACALAALRLLAERCDGDTLAVLLAYAPSAGDDEVTRQLLEVLPPAANKARDAKPLTAAANDPSPERRAAAAFVLGRATDADANKSARALLEDAAPEVRLRAAQGLMAGRQAVGGPTLIRLLPDAPWPVAEQAYDALVAMAGRDAPKALFTDKAADRRACREAWQAWWDRHGGTLDLTRADFDPRLPGRDHTSRQLAQRFLAAFAARDLETVKGMARLPLKAATGTAEIELTEEMLRSAFQGGPRQMTYRVGEAAGGPRIRDRFPNVSLPKFENEAAHDLVAVKAEVTADGRPSTAYVLILWKGGTARVIGVGEQPRPPNP